MPAVNSDFHEAAGTGHAQCFVRASFRIAAHELAWTGSREEDSFFCFRAEVSVRKIGDGVAEMVDEEHFSAQEGSLFGKLRPRELDNALTG